MSENTSATNWEDWVVFLLDFARRSSLQLGRSQNWILLMLVCIDRYRTYQCCPIFWSTWLPISWWSICHPPIFCTASTAIWVSTRSLDRSCCATCALWHFAGYRSWRLGCLDPLGFNGSLWHSGSRYPDTAPANVFQYQWCRPSLASVIPAGMVTVRTMQRCQVDYRRAYVWCAARVSIGTNTVHHVHCRLGLGDGLSPHMYADDTQVYGSCHPAAVDDFS